MKRKGRGHFGSGFQGQVTVPVGVQRHKDGWQIRKTLSTGRINLFVSHSSTGHPTSSLALAVYLLGCELQEEGDRAFLSKWMKKFVGRTDFTRAVGAGLPEGVDGFRKH